MEINDFINRVIPLKNKLFRFAKRMLGNKEDAEDAMQDALVKLWRNNMEASRWDNIEALAVIVTKNTCIDLLRKRKNNIIEFEPEVYSSQVLQPDRKTELSDTDEYIRIIIESFPEQQKMIFHLRDIEGYDNNEIAEITGLSVSNVKTSLSRARKKLREMLIERENYGIR